MEPAHDSTPSFALNLICPQGAIAPPPAVPTVCEHCCHWAFPFLVKAQTLLVPTGDLALPLRPVEVGLRYEAWLAWHWHVITHQHLHSAAALVS